MPKIPFPVDGIVTDVQGSVIENVTIEIHNLRNGKFIKVENATDSNGVYIIDLENYSDFSYTKPERVIIRAYRSGRIFKFGERHAIIEEDTLENQDITLFAENPKTAQDFRDDLELNINEHHPTGNAKKTISVDREGNPTITVAIEGQWDFQDGNFPIYIGEAQPGTKDGDPGWRIKKRTYLNNKFVKSRYADKGRFTQKWSARTSLTYGP